MDRSVVEVEEVVELGGMIADAESTHDEADAILDELSVEPGVMVPELFARFVIVLLSGQAIATEEHCWLTAVERENLALDASS
jgi:hypothetical protein